MFKLFNLRRNFFQRTGRRSTLTQSPLELETTHMALSRSKRVGLSIHLNSFISAVQLVVPVVFLPIGDVTFRVNIMIKHSLPS